MSIHDTVKKLASIRFSLRRKNQVIYRAPGFLHGTYMLEKRGSICHTDLVKHACEVAYGVKWDKMLPSEMSKVRIEIQAIYH